MGQEQIFAKTLHNFPAIASLEIIANSQPDSYDPCALPVKSLLEFCRHVSRDLAYVARLQEDVQDILNTCPEYHATWVSDVRVAAFGALDRANSHITAIAPDISNKLDPKNSPQAKYKVVQKVAKEGKALAILERQLSVAHASLLGVLELMHRLALQRGKLVPEQTQLERLKSMQSVSSLERASTHSPGPTPIPFFRSAGSG
ncbi:hypothetical protein G7054_g6278 [Neopestalotiopsis clavispora]|nr:hypothetical protein G7054_g6278 [Neopestalotiopsis clavispora]